MPIWIVVEDEPDIHDVLFAMFEIWGVNGSAFNNGADALAWIDGVESQLKEGIPDLAILDIRLPDISGVEIAARLRHSPRLRHIGIVLMTAYRLNESQEKQVMKLSQADYLVYKPLPDLEDFRHILDRILAQRRLVKRHTADS